MSIEYLSSFNAGQLSPLLTPRTDLPVYKNGCATLRNFYVLPTGGVERRQGSKYIDDALGAESRLITFNFSSDESYIIEISASDINFFDGTGALLDTITSPYVAADIPLIKYVQSVDIIYAVCPGKPVQQISRLTIAPTFSIGEMTYNYPPFIDENEDLASYVKILSPLWTADTDYFIDQKINYLGVQYSAVATFTSGSSFVGGNWLEVPINSSLFGKGEAITLIADNEIFTEDLENSYFRLSHQRASDTVLLDGENRTGIWVTYEEVYIGGNTVKVNLSNFLQNWKFGTPSLECTIEEKDGVGGSWSTNYSWTTVGAAPQQIISGAGDDYIRVKIRGARTVGPGLSGGSFSIMEGYANRIAFEGTSALTITSDPLDVSYSDWNINTTGTWTGQLELEKSTDGGGIWERVTNITDTAGLSAENITIASEFKEGANTLIRLTFVWASGTLKATINNSTFRSEGVVKITNYVDANTVEAIIQSALLTNATTSRWSYGAFSDARGYPSAVAFHDTRLVFSGTTQDASRDYLSFVDDFTNFLTGVRDSDAIQITPNTNEPTTWLLSRGDALYQGTRGSVVTISTSDGKSITPTNVKALESLEFGGSTIQAIKTNETVVYLERLDKKLREIFYSDEEKGLVSRDLTVMANNISADGFSELVLQRTPDQIIYGLRSDGLLGGLTYERSQDVFGWAEFDFGGTVTSIAIRPSGTHDELWIIIERDGGRYIEQLGSRQFKDDLLDAWYVDSGVKEVLKSTKSSESITISTSGQYSMTVNSTAHGIVSGALIRLDSETDYLHGEVFGTEVIDADTFKLRDIADTLDINWNILSDNSFNMDIGVPIDINVLYQTDTLYSGSGYDIKRYAYDTDFWHITDPNDRVLYRNESANVIPPETTWTHRNYFGPSGSNNIDTGTYLGTSAFEYVIETGFHTNVSIDTRIFSNDNYSNIQGLRFYYDLAFQAYILRWRDASDVYQYLKYTIPQFADSMHEFRIKYDGNSLFIYCDGVIVAQADEQPNIRINNEATVIGYSATMRVTKWEIKNASGVVTSSVPFLELIGFDDEIVAEVGSNLFISGGSPAATWKSNPYELSGIPDLTHNYPVLEADFTEVSKTWDGLDHLEGEVVQVQGDGGFAGEFLVTGGEVTLDEYYNQVVIGLQYFSVMRPMFIETAGVNTKNINKSVNSAQVAFYRTLGGWSGIAKQNDDRDPEFDFADLSDWPDMDQTKYSKEPILFRRYEDDMGTVITPFSGSKRVNYSDTLSRIKNIFIIADAPLPMTVTSLSMDVGHGGRK